MEPMKIVVAGAVNVDIAGTPDTKLLTCDSNPGRVILTLGGVGRNMAENLSRLGQQVELLTVLGEDAHAQHVKESCARLGIGLDHSLTMPGGRTSTYLCLNDEQGEIVAAIADMDICLQLTPDFWRTRLDVLNAASLVLLDANLPEESLTFLARNVTAPMAADPVSVKKAGRLKNALPYLSLLKPNRAEASCLTGVDIHSHEDLPRAAEAFFQLGMRNVFISLGEEGVYYHDGSDSGIVPCFAGPIVNTSGCGDTFLAVSALAWVQGKSLREAARWGQAGAALCARYGGAVTPDMSTAALSAILKGE